MSTPRCLAVAAAIACAATPVLRAQEPTTRTLEVRVDRRVEALSIVFRLAGHPEYRNARLASYAAAVDAHFAEFGDHDVVRRAKVLRRTSGVSYDAPMSFAVHLADQDGAFRFRMPLDPWPAGLDGRWSQRSAGAFLDALNDFARRAKLDAFLAAQAPLYRTACARARAMLDAHADLSWFDGFFGARPDARFAVCLAPLNGPSNYGPHFVDSDGGEELYSILGIGQADAEGLPQFDASVVPTLVHEFCHSYCNPIVDAHADALRPGAEALWPHVEAGMRAQAYGDWRTMMRESLVRACVVRYVAATEGDAARRRQIAEDERREFLWIEELSDLLAEYEQQRDEHPTLESFVPRIVAVIDGFAPKLEAALAKAPKVRSILPAIGQQDVDPTLAALVVTFDRPMLDGAWAVVGGGPNFPEITGRPSYDDSRTVLTIPVRLKPEWSYELWLNRGRFDSFQSEDRVKLRPVQVTFRTGS